MKQFYQTWWALQFTKVIKKQTNKQNKNKIKQLFDHIDLFYSTKRKTIKGTESLEITCLGIH